jgi:5-methylcytosine-specific restriction endonuclease McrA
MTALDGCPEPWEPGTTKAQRATAGLVVDLADFETSAESDPSLGYLGTSAENAESDHRNSAAESDLRLGCLNYHLSRSEDGRRAPGIQARRWADAMNFDVCGSVDLRSQRLESGMAGEISFVSSPMSPARAALDAAVWAKGNGRCWYCGVGVELPPPWTERQYYVGQHGVLLYGIPLETRMYIDHFHSQANGGGDDLSNLVPACRSCNSGKGARDVEVFRWTGYRKKHGPPNFSLEQREWLASQGFVFEGLADFRFWFEREGLS